MMMDKSPNGTAKANSQGHLATAKMAPPKVGANDAAAAAINVFKLKPRPSMDEG